MNDTVKQQNDFTGITAWNNAGFTGKGIRIWNAENTTPQQEAHGDGTTSRILDAAPDVDVTSSFHYINTNGEHITDEYVIENGKKLSAGQFCAEHDFHIVSSSQSGEKRSTEERRTLYGNLRRKYNLTMFNSAGNTGSDGVKGGKIPETEAIYTGACIAFKSNYNDLRMANYSSIGDEDEEVDFSTFTGGKNGTSFSCPYLAGTTALLMQRYGRMASAEVYAYYKMISRPIPTGHPYKDGYDLWSGYGVPILPDPSRRLVRMTIGSKFYKVDGETKTMDTAPFIYQQRTYVPIAFVALALGASVWWNHQEQEVTIAKDGKIVSMWIGKKTYLVNGKPYEMDVAPFILNQRTQVPIAFVSIALGCKVAWIETERKVMILG